LAIGKHLTRLLNGAGITHSLRKKKKAKETSREKMRN
jgi:hypothetical protein